MGLELRPDLAEDARDLRAENEQRDDHDHGDQRKKNAVLSHRLTVLAAKLKTNQLNRIPGRVAGICSFLP